MKSIRARRMSTCQPKNDHADTRNNLRSGFVTSNAEGGLLRMGLAQRNEDEIFPQRSARNLGTQRS